MAATKSANRKAPAKKTRGKIAAKQKSKSVRKPRAAASRNALPATLTPPAAASSPRGLIENLSRAAARQLVNSTMGTGRRVHAITNPDEHSAALLRNRVKLEIWGPSSNPRDKGKKVLKASTYREGNIMCTHGLNRLIEMIASDSDGASKFVSAAAIGTSSTAAASTQDSLVASTQIVHMSQASMVASDAGARTVNFQCTFASNGQACEIHEIGLFCTNNATEKMAARSVLGTASVNRGSADEIRATYQIIAGTA